MKIATLDSPEVRLIAHSGGDEAVLAAMLVSTQADESLQQLAADPAGGAGRIKFLMRNRHGTPFEHNQFRFFVKAPIFVFREFHRHRIGWSYNEESGRYKQLAPHFYLPARDRPMVQVGKPGAYEMVPGDDAQHEEFARLVAEQYQQAYDVYERAIGLGVAKELARMVLPVGIYSSMYATCNARSLMAFLSLRTDDPAATFPSKPLSEIEMVARSMESTFAKMMPITHAAFCEFGRVAP